jgi:hypothetical protein
MKKILQLAIFLSFLPLAPLFAYYYAPSYYSNFNSFSPRSTTVTSSYTIGCNTYYYDSYTGALTYTKNICATASPATIYYGNIVLNPYDYSSSYYYQDNSYTWDPYYSNNSYFSYPSSYYTNYSYPSYTYSNSYMNNGYYTNSYCYDYYDAWYGTYRNSCGY